MSPRPDVSVERKKQILDAAMLVFSRKGLHQAHMDDIVKQSGLSIGTFTGISAVKMNNFSNSSQSL